MPHIRTPFKIRHLKKSDYLAIMHSMQQFTKARDGSTEDELWCIEHAPVFTQGRHGKKKHILNPGDIPVVQSDRGGQITYHGPGQAVIYFLIDLKRVNLGIKDLVGIIEHSMLELLKQYDIDKGHLIEKAPGVFVNNKKIASIGIRVKHGMSYHGISINTNMDLSPFKRINPCGFEKLAMCQLSDFTANPDIREVFRSFNDLFISSFNNYVKFGQY
jgi:lipoyl(octanoyl) transferase